MSNDIICSEKTLYIINKGSDKYDISFGTSIKDKKYTFKPGDAQIIKVISSTPQMSLYIHTLLANGKRLIDTTISNIFEVDVYQTKQVEIIPIQRNIDDSTISENFLVYKQLSEKIYFDDLHEYICIPKKTLFTGKFDRNKSKYYKYSDINGVELQADGQVIESSTRGGLGSALVGGALFGGTGAVVGAITGNKKTSYNNATSFNIRILLNSINNPCETISLGYDRKRANQILSALEIIVKKQDNKDSVNSNDKFEQIKKYKELLDIGAITEDEYNKKKKELLDI